MKSNSYRTIPQIKQLPYALYNRDQIRAMEQVCICQYQISEADLMMRAGKASVDLIYQYWQSLQRVVIYCGQGNNAGDGFVIAKLLHQQGVQVHIILTRIIKSSQKTPFNYFQQCEALKIPIYFFDDPKVQQMIKKSPCLVIDALLGTGLNRPLDTDYKQAVEQINASRAPVLSIDIPTGLNADSGYSYQQQAVKADKTITFIGLKKGLFTADGREYCGEIFYHGLEIPAPVFATQIHAARRVDWQRFKTDLPHRHQNSHKGTHGHLLIIGGAKGMGGAVMMAAQAAFRTGVGKVTIATDPSHAAFLNLNHPEIVCRGIDHQDQLTPLLDSCDAISIGMGLGKNQWACQLFNAALGSKKPLIVDADGLYFLPLSLSLHQNIIQTPHPKEAASLLSISSQLVQQNRFDALQQLQQKFNHTIVLKGAGTLIATNDQQPPAVCSNGNAGMAVAGMGDSLAGILGALVGQGMSMDDAALFGVCLHAKAGDIASKKGEIGMITSDLLAPLRTLINGLD